MNYADAPWEAGKPVDTDKYDGTWFQPCQSLHVGKMKVCQQRTKGWSVATLNGAPGLYRDGKPVAPVLFWQWKIEEEDAKAMSRDAGIDLFGVFGSYPHYANPYWKPEGFAGMAYQDDNLDQILKWVPSAAFLPRLFYSAPDWWIAAHPGERIVYSNLESLRRRTSMRVAKSVKIINQVFLPSWDAFWYYSPQRQKKSNA